MSDRGCSSVLDRSNKKELIFTTIMQCTGFLYIIIVLT